MQRCEIGTFPVPAAPAPLLKLSITYGQPVKRLIRCQVPRQGQKMKRSKVGIANEASKMRGGSSAVEWEGDTLILNILGRPSAHHDAIGNIKGNQLKVSVTVAPRAGKATDHMVRFLAGEFGVLPSDIEVVFGRMNVNKRLRIRAPKRLPAVLDSEKCV